MVSLQYATPRLQSAIGHAPFHTWELPGGLSWTQFFRVNGGYLLRFPDLADFEISPDAEHVTCIKAPDVSQATARHLYLNQVLPLVLSKQGKLVFHGSAIEVDEGAVAFVGASGLGKSTLAACFAVNGYRFLTDDGLVVEPGVAGAFMVLPGHPSIRLWEDSESAFVLTSAQRAPAVGYSSKVRLLAGSHIPYCREARPLRRVYFLGSGAAPRLEIRQLSASGTLLEWVRHSFILDFEEQSRLASHFDQVALLANQPIHYHLDFPRRFSELDEIRKRILAHANTVDEVA